MSNDTDRFTYVVMMIPFFWLGPIQTILSVYLLWPVLGPACLGSISLLIVLMPIQSWLSRKFGAYRGEIAKLTDARVCVVTEIIRTLRLIKAYAWEYACRDTMLEARKKEADLIYRYLSSMSV